MIAAAPTVPPGWQVRVGIHAGPVIAGVVGRRQYLFDVWGDTVNMAARVESLGARSAVNVSGEAWKYVSHLCRSRDRRIVNVKGKGEFEIHEVDGLVSTL